MRDHLSKALFRTREGLILVIGSVIYLVIGVSAKFSQSVALFFGFIGFMALFMPVFLLMMFLKIDGHRRDFLSSWYNTVVMLGVALVPVIVVVKSAIFR